MSRYILNSAVITAAGNYTYELITAAQARAWAAAGDFVSTVGYAETAEALTELLGTEVPIARVTVAMQPGDEALVFRLSFPPGTPRIAPGDKGAILNAINREHYELGLLRRTA